MGTALLLLWQQWVICGWGVGCVHVVALVYILYEVLIQQFRSSSVEKEMPRICHTQLQDT